MRPAIISLVGLFALITVVSVGCGGSSGNTTAAVGHDGKEHGQIKAQAVTANFPTARKGGPRR